MSFLTPAIHLRESISALGSPTIWSPALGLGRARVPYDTHAFAGQGDYSELSSPLLQEHKVPLSLLQSVYLAKSATTSTSQSYPSPITRSTPLKTGLSSALKEASQNGEDEQDPLTPMASEKQHERRGTRKSSLLTWFTFGCLNRSSIIACLTIVYMVWWFRCLLFNIYLTSYSQFVPWTSLHPNCPPHQQASPPSPSKLLQQYKRSPRLFQDLKVGYNIHLQRTIHESRTYHRISGSEYLSLAEQASLDRISLID